MGNVSAHFGVATANTALSESVATRRFLAKNYFD